MLKMGWVSIRIADELEDNEEINDESEAVAAAHQLKQLMDPLTPQAKARIVALILGQSPEYLTHVFGNEPDLVPTRVLKDAFYRHDHDPEVDTTLAKALPGSGPLVQDLVSTLHDNQREVIDHHISKMQMLNDGTPVQFKRNVLRGVKDVLIAVGSEDVKGIATDLGHTADQLADRLGYLDLKVTSHDGPLPRYPNGTVGVSADPAKMIAAWVTQNRKKLDGVYVIYSKDGKWRLKKGVVMVVVVITDANVVSDSSVLGNIKGVFHTTATVLKVSFCLLHVCACVT
jgi:hypothetical protein